MKKKFKIILFVVVALILIVSVSLGVLNFVNKKIDRVLASESYSYLPKQAKNYIKKVYEKTGKIILTERNKQKNMPYLNPEYIEYLQMEEDMKKQVGNIPMSTVVDYSFKKDYSNASIPSYYNLDGGIDNNFITPVRDQGNLGLCWAFASAGVVESYLLKTNNLSYTNSSQLISERQIDYATAINGINDYKSEYVSFADRYLGDGGNFFISTIAMANGVSLTDYNKFKKYDDTDLTPMELSDILSYKNSLFEVNKTINMPMLNLRASTANLTDEEILIRQSYINEVKQNIMNYGAAYVSTNMNNNCSYYDTNLDNTVIDLYRCNTANGSHAMQIIGWNDNIEYSYCADTNKHTEDTTNCNNIVNGKGVWILKNSWGKSSPNPYLAYDSLHSSIFHIKELVPSNNKIWDNNYILGSEVDLSEKEYLLSDTKIMAEEKLEKIKFITSSTDSTYNIKIIKSNGSYEEIKKTTDYPGLVTVDVISKVVIDKESKIIISSENGTYIDKVSLFTSNIDEEPYIELEKYNNKTISEHNLRFYSETKNIPSGALITYKLYDKDNNDVSVGISYTNNTVAENNVNTYISFLPTLNNGSYRLDVIYDSEVINSINLKYAKMEGAGTESDPYVITNSVQLDQIREDLDAYYVLGNDIDLTDDTREGGRFYDEAPWGLGGLGWTPIKGFSGTLDGQGHTIKGLYQNNYLKNEVGFSRRNNYMGLFSLVLGNVSIKNIILEDFDIKCHDTCGMLFGTYKFSETYDDDNEYNPNFSNIVAINSNISSDVGGDSQSHIGGIFGLIAGNSIGKINISNIYSDVKIGNFDSALIGALASNINSFAEINIKNIQLVGSMVGKNDDGSDTGLLSHRVIGENINVENIFSTVYGEKIGANMFRNLNVFGSISIKNVNMLKIPNRTLFGNLSDDKATLSNVNLYDKGINSDELSNPKNYDTWEDFDKNWIMKPIDDINRFPILNFVDFDYTSIEDILIKQELNKKYNIYEYITPKTEYAKKIIYKLNDESIARIDEDGYIIPQSTGKTTIYIESLYDGYIKDVPITINYKPHYTINFDGNGADGIMDSIEVSTGTNYKLPSNIFMKDMYMFSGWNTKADGTGISYDDLSEIKSLEDKEELTLYAQWIGEEFEITFDADGGSVTPATKKVRFGETYGELPIPIKDGFGFSGWYSLNGNMYISISNSSDVYYYYRNFTARWKENAYTIVLNPNGGSGIKTHSCASFNSNNYLSENTYTKEGYVFSGWNTKADGTGISYEDKAVINLSDVENSLLNLYAQWTPIIYNINFNSNGGIGTMNNQSAYYDEEITLLENTFTKNNHKFKEWNTKADGTGVSYQDKQKVMNLAKEKNVTITLYAIWEDDFIYKINKYLLDKENKYISHILVNTTVDSFKENVIVNKNYKIDVDYKLIEDMELLYTGGKTKIYNDKDYKVEFTNIVIGDVNGDGEINSGDLFKVRQHLLKINTLTDVYHISADVNYDSEINSGDLFRIRQHLLGTVPIS